MSLVEMRDMPAVQVPAEAVTLVRYYSGGEENQEEWNERNRQRAQEAAANNDLEELVNINALTMLHDQSLAAEEQLRGDWEEFEREG